MKIKSFLFLLICFPTILLAQEETKFIKLAKEKSPLHLRNYHITKIIDERTDTTNIGILHSGLSGKRNVHLKLQPNVQAAIKEFISTNTIQDTSTTSIELRISKLFTDHLRNGLKNRLDLGLTIAFYAHGEKVTDYNGDGYSEGVGDPLKPIEEVIRKNILNGMERFDEYWAKNKAQFQATTGAPLSVKVMAELSAMAKDSDMIVYATNRPLVLNDFAGVPDDLSRASAVTYSGIQLFFSSETKDGHLAVRVQIIPYFSKPYSWCRKTARNSKTLLHEQKHFDLTAFKACELLKLIQQTTFTANYEQELNALYKKNEKEWDQLQRQYDTETKHGQIAATQEKWNTWIKEELAKRSCFK